MGNEIWPWYWQEKVYKYDVIAIYSDSDWAHLGKTDTDAYIYMRQSNSNAYIGVAH